MNNYEKTIAEEAFCVVCPDHLWTKGYGVINESLQMVCTNQKNCPKLQKYTNALEKIIMNLSKYKHTPENIEELADNEVFVFGSNLNGHHAGGAARVAHQKFGAEWGVGEGLTGQCYAFPTLDENM